MLQHTCYLSRIGFTQIGLRVQHGKLQQLRVELLFRLGGRDGQQRVETGGPQEMFQQQGKGLVLLQNEHVFSSQLPVIHALRQMRLAHHQDLTPVNRNRRNVWAGIMTERDQALNPGVRSSYQAGYAF